MEERLDPDYFRTTPKSSWELFKWLFTEPIKLEKFKNTLSLKKNIIWALKAYIFLIILVIFLLIILNIQISFSFDKIILVKFFGFGLLFIIIFGLTGLEVISHIIGAIIMMFVIPLIIYPISNYLIFIWYPSIFFGLHIFLYDLFSTVTLKNNFYLMDSYYMFTTNRVQNQLANDTFMNLQLGDDFILFLFEFRPYQRKLAFYLSNVSDASFLYHNKLYPDSIYIYKYYEENEPTQNFTDTLGKLKNELEKYQVQTNIHHKIISLQRITEILKDLEQQMIIEKRGWSEYYLKAIRANLDEANARLQNDELEAKNLEPITSNIYEIGNPLSPNYQNQLFKGRRSLADRLSNIIYTSQQMPLLLIQGQRRVGKTSLINYLEQLLGSGFKIVKLDMQSATNKKFGSLVKNINQELNSMLGIDKTIETSDDIMQSWIAFEEY